MRQTGASTEATEHRRFMPEIQALRALAVTLVLAYHLFPLAVPGGYVGVDVFFVISGYLITAHLLRELDKSGRVGLGRFYARRARRLLPVALVVLLFVVLAVWLFVPQVHWIAFSQQIISSTFYFQNWQLAADSVSYSALAADASPVQHYWSLSVEEQFYIAWPLLLILASLVGRRAGRVRTGLAALILLAIVTSFAYSVWFTAVNAPVAYFSTFTRAWEFGVGALLAWGINGGLPSRTLANAARCLGATLILVSAATFTAQTPFPGYLALLPAVGTGLIIAAAEPEGRFSARRVIGARPVQVLGDISYSVYLWHWPLIVLIPYATSVSNPLFVGVLTVASTVPLSLLSKRFIEDRFRAGGRTEGLPDGRRRLVHDLRNSGVVVGAALGMVCVSTIAGGLWGVTAARAERASAQEASIVASADPDCFGAAALISGAVCAPTSSVPVVPDPVFATENNPNEECKQTTESAVIITCTFGSDSADAVRVALVGDSHAQRWLPALEPIAEAQGWSITTYWKSSCAFSAVDRVSDANGTCGAWNSAVVVDVEDGGFAAVFVSAVTGVDFDADEGETPIEAGGRGMAEWWSRLESAGTRVVAIRDNPRPGLGGLEDPPSCVLAAGDGSSDVGKKCAVEEGAAVQPDPQILAARAEPRAEVIDLTDLFCRNGTCPAVVGGVLVYRDDSHVIDLYATTISPYLADRIREVEPSLFS